MTLLAAAQDPSSRERLAQWRRHTPPCILIICENSALARDHALWLIKLSLCHTPQHERPCEQCQSCHLFDENLHPDLIAHPQALAIDDIRLLAQHTALTPEISTKRMIYLGNLQDYNPHAANALLKTLEEPNPHSHFILSANKKRAVLATIQSRSQSQNLPPLNPETAADWLVNTQNLSLEQAHALLRERSLPDILSAPQTPDPELAAAIIHMLKNPAECAILERIKTLPPKESISIILKNLIELIRLHQLDIHPRQWQHVHHQLKKDCRSLPASQLHQLYQQLAQLLASPNNQNPVYQLQALMLQTAKDNHERTTKQQRPI